MVLTVKDAKPGHVKLLTLSHAEVEAVRTQAERITQSMAPDAEHISPDTFKDALAYMPFNRGLAITFKNVPQQLNDMVMVGRKYKKYLPEDPVFALSRECVAKLQAGGLTPEDIAFFAGEIHAKYDEGYETINLKGFKKTLTEYLVGKALKAKIGISGLAGATPTVDELIKHEINHKKAYLDTWTEIMAGQNPPFDAREQFRDQVKMTGRLVTDEQFFMPDQIEGIRVSFGNEDPNNPVQLQVAKHASEKYHNNRGFIDVPYEDRSGDTLHIVADAYTIDHRLLEHIQNGKAGERVLRDLASMSTLASHDTLHGAMITPMEGVKDSPLQKFLDWRKTVKFPRREAYNAFEGRIKAVEIHAIQTHHLIMDKMFEQRPAMKTVAMTHAAEFANSLSQWEQHLVKTGETSDTAHEMASVMAHQYIERMTCNWNLDDPIYTTKLAATQGKTLAELYSQFAPAEVKLKIKEREAIELDIPHFSHSFFPEGLPHAHGHTPDYTNWQKFVLEHIRHGEHRAQMQEYEPEHLLKPSSERRVPPNHVTSGWQNVLLSASPFLNTDEADMLTRHQSGKDDILAARAKRAQLRSDLQLDALLGDTGLIAQLEQEPISDKLRQAIERFKAQAKQAGVTIENRGQLYRAHHGQNETELPRTIDQLLMHLDQLPDSSLVSEMADRLTTMKTNWAIAIATPAETSLSRSV